MNPSKTSTLPALAALLCLGGTASAQSTFTFIGTPANTTDTSYTTNWTTPSNWSPAGPPTSSTTTTVNLDDTNAKTADPALTSQIVQYDISAGGGNLGTLNLLNGAGMGVSNTLQLTSNVNASGTTRLTVANAITLGTSAGTVEIRLTPALVSATVGGTSVLTGTAGLTINSGGLVTLDGSAATGTATTSAVVNANTTINSGGTLSILGNSSAGGIGINTNTSNTLTLNTGGLIAFNAAGTSTTGRLQIYGNFTTTGGAITGSANTTGGNVLELYGATNTIGATTFNNPAALSFSFRGGAAQTLTSAADLPNILARNGFVNTVSSTSTNQSVGTISISSTASTIQLGSNLNTATLPSFTIAGATLDLNGNTLNVTATGALTPTTSTIFKSTVAGGTLQVASFNFGNLATPSQVQAGTTIVTAGTPANNNMTAGNLVSTSGNATFDPTSTLVFTANSTSATGNRLGLATPTTAGATNSTIGNLIVGTGTSTTYVQLMNGTFAIGGSASVLTGSTLDLNSRAHTVAGKLQGNGTVSGASPATLTFTGTGGLSPGFSTTGNTGSNTVGMLTLAGTETLAFATTSVSLFDLASDTSFDKLVAGGNILTFNSSTINVNLLNGYNPAVNTTWTLFTGLSASSSLGANGVTVTNNQGDTFSFGITGTNGILTLTSMAAVPEPSTWAMVGIGMLFFVAPMRRAFRRGCQR